MKKFSAIASIFLGGIYLLNFTFGIFELPDNLPFVGHIDETIAAAMLFAGLRYFGFDLTNWFKPTRKENREDKGV